MAYRNPRDYVVSRSRKIIDEGLAMLAHEAEQPGNIDDGYALRCGGGDEQLRLVGRYHNRPGQGIVAVEFIDGDLHGSAHVFAEKRERIAKNPSVLDVS